MARADPLTEERQSLYERDFYLWIEQQAALLREGRLDELDVANLLEEIESTGRKDKKAIKSNLVIVLLHLVKHESNRSDDPEVGLIRSSSTGSVCAMTSKKVRVSGVTSRRYFPRPMPMHALARSPRRGCRSGFFPKPRPTPWNRPSIRSSCRIS